ncbi:MAG: hypothetical protein AABZ50_05220 [Pseudomonadota bacterium]
MYEVDDKDQVIEFKGVPQSSVGAPNPILLAGEHDVFLTYYLEDTPEGWDGTSVRIVGTDTEGEPVAVVKFKHCTAHMFGPPNDEAFSGHPLAERGLGPYGVFEIKNSSWIRKLEKMNAVHPYHDKRRFMENKKHFIFSFHDTTFECVAEEFTVEVSTGSVKSMVPHMLESVR